MYCVVPGLTTASVYRLDWRAELLGTGQLLHHRLRNLPQSSLASMRGYTFTFRGSHPARACRSFCYLGSPFPLKVHSTLTSTPVLARLRSWYWFRSNGRRMCGKGELWEYSSDSDVDKLAGDPEASKCSFYRSTRPTELRTVDLLELATEN